MSTYLLAWNPKKYPWDDLEECVDASRRNCTLDGYWACAATNKIVDGDRIFLMRLGDEDRGIVASGWAQAHEGVTVLPWSDVYEAAHWNEQAESETTWYIDIRFDALLGRERTLPLSRLERLNENLPTGAKEQWWTPQKSGIRIQSEIAARLEKEWQRFLASGTSTYGPEEISRIKNTLQARSRTRRRVRPRRTRRFLVNE